MSDRPRLQRYEISLLLAAFLYNAAVYWGGKTLAEGRIHHSFALAIDGRIPFLPGTVVIYVGAFLFWAGNYAFAVSAGRREANRFILAHIIGETICFLFFVIVPTTMTRPAADGTLPLEWAARLLYKLDSAGNLFPSIHCFASWMSWIGVRRNRKISVWYRRFSLLFALAVCASTLTVKQHVFADTVAGVILAEASSWAAGRYIRAREEKKMAYIEELIAMTKEGSENGTTGHSCGRGRGGYPGRYPYPAQRRRLRYSGSALRGGSPQADE